MNKTNGFRDQASASTSLYSREHNNYKQRPSSSAFPTFLRWFKKNDRDQQKPRKILNGGVLSIDSSRSDSHDTLDPSSSPTLGNLTPSSSCDSVISTSTTGFAFIKPQNYKPYKDAEAPRIYIAQSPETESYRRRIKKYNNSETQNSPGISLKEKYFLYDADTLKSTDICEGVYDNLEFYDRSLPNVKNSTSTEDKNTAPRRRHHRRTVSDSSKDKKSGAYVHVKGKRKAPPPPTYVNGIILENEDFYERIENRNNCGYYDTLSPKSTLNRKKRRAPSPPSSPGPPTQNSVLSEGLLDDKEIKAIIAGTTCNNRDSVNLEQAAMPSHYSKHSSENLTNSLKRGSLKSNKSGKSRFPPMIINTNADSKLENAEADVKLVPPISPISPRPWYKRPISVNRESAIPFKREVVLKTMEKRKSKQKEKDYHLSEVGYSRSSIFDTANKFGFFMRTKDCHNDKSNNKDKRRSGIGIPNISELDREAAEIVNKEHANQRAKIQAEREKFFNPPEHLILQQQMFGFKSNNCDDKQESHETDPVSTKDLISKFEASSNIARITINTTFIGPTDYFPDKKTEETKIKNEPVEITENTGKIINENTETSKSEAINSDTTSDALSKQSARPDDKQKLTGNDESTKEASETAEKKEAGTNLVTKMSWSCPFCTLENPSWRIICEVCEKLKPFDILNKPSVAADSDPKVEHKPPTNVEPTLKTSNQSLESINFVGKYINKNQNKKAEQADEWEKKTEKVLKYFLPRNTTNALSKSCSESTVGKKPPIFRKSPSPSKLPTSSPNIPRKTRLHEQQKLSNKTLQSKKDDSLCTTDKKKPLLDSSVIVTTVTPVFFATTTVVKNSEQTEDSNVIDLKEVRHARLAKFQPNLLTEAKTPPTDAMKTPSVTSSQKIADYGAISPQPAEGENLLNDHDTLEREKRRLREKIRAMNAKALAEKYPLQKSLSLDEKTKSNESLNDLDGKAQEVSKLGAIKKVFAKNRCSEYFGNFIAMKQEDAEARVTPPPRPKKVSTSVQTSALVKRTVSPDGAKSKSKNDLLETETDASKDDKNIYANVSKYENLSFNKVEKNSEQYEKLSDLDKVKVHEITAQLQSQQGLNDFKATLKNPLRSISKTDTIALSKIMRNLELAISEGQHELAAGIAMDLAKMKVSLQVTKIKNRPTSSEIQDLSQAIIVDLYVKDEMSQKGPIQMTVKPLMTILELKEKASNDFDIPVRLQKWLINNEPAAGDDKTLLECGLKDSKSVFYLHLLAPVIKGPAEKQVNDLEPTNLQRGNIPDKDGNLSDVSSDSYNDLYSEDYLEGATALPVTTANEKPKIVAVKEKPSIVEANETKLEGKEKRQTKDVTEESPENPWECPLCTLINNYNNLTCLACSKAKPLIGDLKQKIVGNLFSEELKHFLEFDKTLERPEANKNDLNKTNPNRKSSEIFNIIETKATDNPQAEPAKVVPSYSSPNITKNKYRGVDNYNPNRKISYGSPATKNVSPRKEKGRAPPPPNTSTNHYLELLKLDHSEAVPNTESFECPVCFMKFQSGEGVVLRDCLHVFCKECISNTVQFSEEAEVKCPYMDVDYSCDSVLQDREVKAVVSKEIYEKHLAKSVRVAEYQIENTFHCKTPNCRGWCIYEDNVNQFKCPVCRITNCLTCRVIHDGLTCKQYQDRLNSDSDSNVEAKRTKEMLAEMVEKGEAMNCPTCQVIMMKKWGCDWLKCSMCKTEVCWVTRGPRWGPGGKGDTTGGCKCGVDGKKCHPKCNYCH